MFNLRLTDTQVLIEMRAPSIKGDRVMGMVQRGSYMDYVAVEEDLLAVIPESLSFEEAGAAPTVALTAWQALFEHGRLQPGQRILVQAGAGGVEHAAVQLAKQYGAYVIATARDYTLLSLLINREQRL